MTVEYWMRQVYLKVTAMLVFLAPCVDAADPVWPKLTERLKGLFSTEMQQISESMGTLTTAIATGDHESVKYIGISIRDSFVLKKSLTEQDKEDLMSALPPEFLELDQRFHQYADKLANAAESKDSELQEFYLSRMVAACVNCHRQFAHDVFPGFDNDGEDKHLH